MFIQRLFFRGFSPPPRQESLESRAARARIPVLSPLPRHLLYATSARLGGSGLDAVALETLRAAQGERCLERALAFDNRQHDIPAGRIRTLRWHPVRLLSGLGSQYYYGAKKRALDGAAARELRGGDYDFFHGWSGEAVHALREAKRLGVPSVLEIPTWHRHKGKEKPTRLTKSERERAALPGFPGWKARLLITRQQMLEEYDLATLLLVLSEKAEETFLAAGVPRRKLFRHQRGVDVERFQPAPRPPEIFRAVFVGALIRRKGVHHLLEVWHRLQLREAELVLAGKVHPEMEETLRACAGPSVVVRGFVPRVEEIYREAAVHVFPSTCEGSAKTTYEAAACGLPQITTREAGDVVQEGENGLLIPPDDPDALAAALQKLHADRALAQRLGEAGRARVVENFTWGHFRARLLEALPHRGDGVKILALQLKRIGDLILTTPALAALRTWAPEVHLTLAVAPGCAGLLPLLPQPDAAIVLGPGRGWTPWQQALTGRFEAVVDFTGSDRSALFAFATRAPRRRTFAGGRRVRALAYGELIASSVRAGHTVDHYLALAGAHGPAEPVLAAPPPSPARERYAVLHPGSARPEKYWPPERWAELIAHLRARSLRPVLTGGPHPFERAHLAEIIRRAGPPLAIETTDLPTLASLIAGAELVVSVDTAAMHLAAAYRRPQIALFGPTNPFHWRPRHPAAVILSATQPAGPLTHFEPRLRGAPMDALSTATVIHATDALLPHHG